MKHIVIVGNGIAGITAARHIRKLSNNKITIISAESDHFYSRTALMYIFMGHMKYEHTKPYEDGFWKKNRLDLLRDYVEAVDVSQKTLKLQRQGKFAYDILIIASGSKSNKLGWPGQDLKGVQGLYNLQDLEAMEQTTKTATRAVIVGGGLIGIEMAEMLLTRKIPVTLLIREENYWENVLPPEEAALVSRQIKSHHVDLRNKTELQEILSDANGAVASVLTKNGEEIPCQLVGLTVGVSPAIDFLKGSTIKTDRGILVNRFFETNIEDIYAIGDCAQFIEPPIGRKAIEQVWYTGRMHGETLAYTICNQKVAYNPGPWFNSAKFMDIEYQIYGEVSAQPQAHEKHIYWEHENGQQSIRIVYHVATRKVIGFNLMGVRYKHAVCNAWLENEAIITEVMQNLRHANFDPEFFKKYEEDVVHQYNLMEPEQPIEVRKKKFWKIF